MMERQELFDALTDAMCGAASGTVLGGRLRPGRTVKSRLLEAHVDERSPDGVSHLIRTLADSAGLTVERAGDELWALLGSDDAFVVDTLNPRFWLLHTTAPAQQLRRLLAQHLLPSARLDCAWFSREQLRELEGVRRWVRSSFDGVTLQPGDVGGGVPRRWRVQVEGESPEELLELVSKQERYGASAALTAVASVLDTPAGGRVEVAADYQGGFVASGDDFHTVAGVLWRVLDRYERYVQALEATYRMGASGTETTGLTLEGEVAMIEFPHEVGDLASLVGNLFNCREPFRLWAVPREIRDGQWEANAVDLHVGQRLRFELTSRWVRVLLGSDTCGNTLARLVANLQHRLDARVCLPLALAA